VKPIWKHIIASACALIVVGYMGFGLWMSRHRVAQPACAHLNVLIEDQALRQYVSALEIQTLIRDKHISPIGKYHHQLALQGIEDVVRKHPMVRTAECYATMEEDVNVRLTQRVPLARIMTGAETFFVDTDRKIMPVRASVTTPVLMVYGEVGKRMAGKEVADFALWLEDHPYWKQRIDRVEVVNPKMIHLIQTEERAMIVLGDWNGFERKLNKLHHFYEANTGLDLAQYPVVDVRFHGQVIGIINSESQQ